MPGERRVACRGEFELVVHQDEPAEASDLDVGRKHVRHRLVVPPGERRVYAREHARHVGDVGVKLAEPHLVQMVDNGHLAADLANEV